MPATTSTATAARAVDLSERSTLRGIDDLADAIGLRRVATCIEQFRGADGMPVRRAAATAIVRNPWLGTGTSADLSPATERVAPVLAKILADRLLHALGGAQRIEAFGKAAFAGHDGELEHAAALIHTPYFGNLVREALDGTSILCFVDGRAQPGDTVRVPLWHKTAAATRSHYQTVDVLLSDGPHRDELAIIAVAGTGGRPHARIGDRSSDRPVTADILKGIAL